MGYVRPFVGWTEASFAGDDAIEKTMGGGEKKERTEEKPA
jgi:hypothetical protein